MLQDILVCKTYGTRVYLIVYFTAQNDLTSKPAEAKHVEVTILQIRYATQELRRQSNNRVLCLLQLVHPEALCRINFTV